ncbi:MAG TPA: sugar phosphate isomerase/epimerase [Ktedonobacterales bacterium]|nr:sugar phosphate isomerase/epimerase [Ktedonobacterales bacterium]
MRISFSTGTFYHRGLAYSLGLARAAGFDGVELVVGARYVRQGIAPYRHAVGAGDIPVLSVHPPFYLLPGWPRRFTQSIPQLAGITRALGGELCVVHTPFLSNAETPRAQRYTAGLRQGLAAGGQQVRISLESSQYNERDHRYLLDDLRALVDFAQERDCAVTFDTCHAGANGEDLLECYEIVRPALRNVHLSDVVWRDGKPLTHRLPGEGALPLASFLSLLARDGYDGLITLEIHPREASLWSHTRSIQRLKKALEFVRGAIAQPAARTS